VWDTPLDKLRSSRLLALRMHVARYVVRTGARQRTAVALLDEPTLATRGPLMVELLEAAGAAFPQVAPLPSTPDAALPLVDVLLFGRAGSAPAELAAELRAASWLAATSPSAQVWALDLDTLLRDPGPELVASVETLIRIVIPEALGANGTPPLPHQAVRVA
jgi:hypothetical protein